MGTGTRGCRWGEAAVGLSCLLGGGRGSRPAPPWDLGDLPPARPLAIAGPGRGQTDGRPGVRFPVIEQVPVSAGAARLGHSRPACLLPAAGGFLAACSPAARAVTMDGNSILWSPGFYRCSPGPRLRPELPQGPSEPLPRAASHGGGPARSHIRLRVSRLPPSPRRVPHRLACASHGSPAAPLHQ